MNSSDSTGTNTETALNRAGANAVMAREAGGALSAAAGQRFWDRSHRGVVKPDGGCANALPCVVRA